MKMPEYEHKHDESWSQSSPSAKPALWSKIVIRAIFYQNCWTIRKTMKRTTESERRCLQSFSLEEQMWNVADWLRRAHLLNSHEEWIDQNRPDGQRIIPVKQRWTTPNNAICKLWTTPSVLIAMTPLSSSCWHKQSNANVDLPSDERTNRPKTFLAEMEERKQWGMENYRQCWEMDTCCQGERASPRRRVRKERKKIE